MDSTVTPFLDWSVFDRGPNFRGAPPGVSRVSPDAGVLRPNQDGAIVQVPLSCGYRGQPLESRGRLDGRLRSPAWQRSRLDAASLDEELLRPAEWLPTRFAAYIPSLAYLYGESSASVEQAAVAAGYVGALRVTGGWYRPTDTTARHAIPRYNVPAGLSHAGFTFRTAGLGLR